VSPGIASMTWLFQAPSESISGIMVKPYRSEGGAL
jgi:hypothetical protein